MKSYLNILKHCFSAALVFFALNSLQAQTVTTKTKITEKTQKTDLPVVVALPVGATAIVSGKSKVVNVDLSLHAFSDVIPFDEPFLIVGTPGATDNIKMEDLIRVDAWWAEKKEKGSVGHAFIDEAMKEDKQHSYWIQNNAKSFIIPVTDFLKPNRNYVFIFKYGLKINSEELNNWVEKTSNDVLSNIIKEAQSANNGRYTFNDNEMDAIIRRAEKELNEALKVRQVGINFDVNNRTHYKQFFTYIKKLAQAFSEASKNKNRVEDRISFLKTNTAAPLDSLFFTYKSNLNANLADSSVVKKVIDFLPQIYDYPKDAAISDSTKYLKRIKDFKTSIESMSSTNAKFTSIKSSLISRIDEIASNFSRYAKAESERSAAEADAERLVEILAASLFQISYINGSTVVNDFSTRANSYISADLGVAMIPDISMMSPYLGTNIYLRPINKSYPISWRNNLGEDFFRRFSFLIGLTIVNLEKTGSRANLLANNFNLITGAGFRVSDGVRINGGMVWYSQVNPNPLNSNKNVVGSGFFSLSFDLDVKTVFNHLFTTTKIPTIKIEN